MIWLIILLVVGLVFAPAMWLRPSPRQARITGLRETAREQGVAVRLDGSPLHDDGGKRPAYRWRYPPQQPGPDFLVVRDALASQSLRLFQAGWRWRVEPLHALPDEATARLASVLQALPDDAVVIESSAACLTLWWDESLSQAQFIELAADMAELRDLLAGRPDYPEAQRSTRAPGVPPSMTR